MRGARARYSSSRKASPRSPLNPCRRAARRANSVRHPDTGKPMIDDGAELSPTMCTLVDNVLASHGFGMFVLGMLCGLACAFCAYLLITRCRSQPKQRRPFYSDSEPAHNTRGAQGDVAEL